MELFELFELLPYIDMDCSYIDHGKNISENIETAQVLYEEKYIIYTSCSVLFIVRIYIIIDS